MSLLPYIKSSPPLARSRQPPLMAAQSCLLCSTQPNPEPQRTSTLCSVQPGHRSPYRWFLLSLRCRCDGQLVMPFLVFCVVERVAWRGPSCSEIFIHWTPLPSMRLKHFAFSSSFFLIRAGGPFHPRFFDPLGFLARETLRTHFFPLIGITVPFIFAGPPFSAALRCICPQLSSFGPTTMVFFPYLLFFPMRQV